MSSDTASSAQQDADTQGLTAPLVDREGVAASIARIAARAVPGVADAQPGGFIDKLTKRLGRRGEAGAGIEVIPGSDEHRIEVIHVRIAVEQGQVIPTVATAVQRGVKEAVERMTSLEVAQVNVFVESIQVPGAAEAEPEPEGTEGTPGEPAPAAL